MISLSYKKNKIFYQTLLAIAIPVTIQNLITSSLNLVDNIMIGQLGADAIAAVGLANQVFFLLNLVLFGANSAVSIFVAQYWGKKEYSKIKDMLCIGLAFGGLIAGLFFIAGFVFPDQILSIFQPEDTVLLLGTQYLQIACFTYILMAFSFTFGFTCRSVGYAKIPMYTSAIALGINTVLNYLLIFGIGIFPELGVRGAAVATVIARIIELVLLLYFIRRDLSFMLVKISDFVKVTLHEVVEVFKTGLPVILNETFWALGTIMYTYVYSRMGTDSLSSIQIANTINQIFMVVGFGIGNAAAVILGNRLGANEIEEAKQDNAKILSLAGLVGVVVGIAVAILSPIIVETFYVLPEALIQTTITLMRVMAVYIPFRFISAAIVIGTLRSGGDTVYSMLLDIGCVWLIGVPIAFISGLYFMLPVPIVYGLVTLEEVMKTFIGLPRVKSGKWAKNIVSK